MEGHGLADMFSVAHRYCSRSTPNTGTCMCTGKVFPELVPQPNSKGRKENSKMYVSHPSNKMVVEHNDFVGPDRLAYFDSFMCNSDNQCKNGQVCSCLTNTCIDKKHLQQYSSDQKGLHGGLTSKMLFEQSKNGSDYTPYAMLAIISIVIILALYFMMRRA